MLESIEFRSGDVRASIRALKERLANPAPVLRELARKVTADVRANIKAGGTGWPPYAESTRKRLEATGTSQVSAKGTIRADRVKRTLKQLGRIEKQAKKTGWTPDLSTKVDKLRKRLGSYRKAEAAAARRGERAAKAEQTIESLRSGPLTAKESRRADRAKATLVDTKKDRLGKRQAANHPLLNRIPGTIRSKLIDDGRTLYVYSRAGIVGAIHNVGVGKTPKRQFLPPPNMPEVMAYFKELMESDLGQAWDSPRGRR